MKSSRIWFGVALVCLLAGSVRPEEAVFLPRSSTWVYLRGLAEASTPDTAAWTMPGFDDTQWEMAPAPFGYGDGPFGTDLSDLDPPMHSNYSSLYLRTTFEVPRPDEIVKLEARVDYDDGFVLWINGHELLRDRVEDPITFDSKATQSRESGAYIPFDLPDPSAYIVAGTNTIAVQAFNQSLRSSDFKIDVEIADPLGPDRSPPEMAVVVPAAGITVRKLTQIEVTFTEDVTGVDAGDLLVAGLPATGVSGVGSGPYVFVFAKPAVGPVQVAWVAQHGIRDGAKEPNAFAGGAWSYTLDPDAPLPDVVISEFLAANRAGLKDEDGEASDWIEIHNESPQPADLAGWALTDDRDNTSRWTFPPVTLDPNGYLVVFASGKDRRDPAGELHTNFKLASGGEYLALYSFESPRVVVSELSPGFPRQRDDIAYGTSGSGALGYLVPPTPGKANGSSVPFTGIAAAPRFTPERGFYDEPISVEIYTPTAGAAIYYTLDGTEPGPQNGLLYDAPVPVAPTARKAVATVRAIAVRDDMLPSEVTTHTYISVADVLTQPSNPDGFPLQWKGATSSPPSDYAMDARVVNANREECLEGLLSIPTISVVMAPEDFLEPARGIYANPNLEGLAWERPASAEWMYPDGQSGFQIDCGIRIQGGSSTNTSPRKAYKLSMRLLFKGDYGAKKLEFPLFPDSPVDTFDSIVLDAHLNLTFVHPDHGQRVRSQYVRDAFASDLQNAMGSLAPHDVFAHLYVNGLYWGLYDVHERPDASFAQEYLGGDKEEYDVFRHQYSLLVDGNRLAWDEMFRRARAGVADTTAYLGLMEYLDVQDLADYMIMNLYIGNDDWPRHNWYTARRRVPGAGFRFFSWDAEHVLKNVGINQTGVSLAGSPAELYARLRQNADFRILFADRVHRHFFGGCLYVDPENSAWDPEQPERNRPAALYMRRIDEIDPAIRLESARWGDNRRPSQPYTRDNEWLTELNGLLRNYFPRRSEIVLSQFRSAGLYPRVGAPVFSSAGGVVDPGLLLGMSLPEGTEGAIYFTTDGTDPRIFGTGEAAPQARLYAGPVAIDDTATVKARTFSDDTWSALSEASFVLALPEDFLQATEILYNPLGGGEYEFLELHNASAYTLDLSGLVFTRGVDFVFAPGATLGAGEYLVLASDPVAFESRYPGVELRGVYAGRLSNAGEKITLKDAAGQVVLSVDYGDEGFWPIGADGFGYSLVPLDTAGDLDDPLNWRASAEVHGSPGAPDPEPPRGAVVINEVLARSRAPLEDAIELFNPESQPVDVGGWYLSDSRQDETALKKFRIPAGTTIAPGGYLVLYAHEFNPPGGGGFDLSASGGGVYLAAAAPGGSLTGYIVGHEFDGVQEGVSLGRFSNSQGPEFIALSRRTFGVDDPSTVEEFRSGGGAPNSGPKVGPVVINEVEYHPPPGGDEFVELYNITGSAVDVGGWQLKGVQAAGGAGSFQFAEGTVVPPGGYLLAVGVAPEFFRARYAVDARTFIAGPFDGSIDNGGETLRLVRPYDGEGAPGAAILVDRVRYNDKLPWPEEADGGGASLERLRPGDHGNDPVNWAASLVDGGTPGAPNSVSGGPSGGWQLPGDGNQDGVLNLTDPVALLGHLFLGQADPFGCSDGPLDAGGNAVLLDANDDAKVNLADAVYVLNYLFLGGAPPAAGTGCVRISGCPEACAP